MILSSGKRAINTDQVLSASLVEATIYNPLSTTQAIEVVSVSGHAIYIAPVTEAFPNKQSSNQSRYSAEADPLLFADLLSYYFSDR